MHFKAHLENEEYLCAPQPRVSFITGFSRYKSSLSYMCGGLGNKFEISFIFKAFLWGWGLKQGQGFETF